tara:strand:- start:24 stop:416 length:393 start_codon:yes stop_codon:yes gene_type:complete
MNNKLYCTFVQEGNEDELVQNLFDTYPILFGKIFVLSSMDEDKIMVTYNIDFSNFHENIHIPNTILVHRKKQTNTLYTINALNEVIKHLNGGFLDTSYRIPWDNYRNSLLLTKELGFKKIKTRLKAIKEG